MESLLLWIVVSTTLGGALSALGASVVLLLPVAALNRLLAPLVSFAIGTLLGAALLALLPEALESPGIAGAHTILIAVLLGLLGFFLLEKLVIWRHCHVEECEVHGSTGVAGDRSSGAAEVHAGHAHSTAVERAQQRAAGSLILVGDGIHNLVDGVLIAAAFLTSVELGVVTSIAVIAHEIPQELGDFAVLLHSGFSRAKALFYNVLSSVTTVVGGVVAYFSLGTAQQAVPYVLAIAAASFLYVAVADLIPGLHKRPELGATLQQIVLITAGVALIYATHSAMH
jgi:zinc and cadmium transporter